MKIVQDSEECVGIKLLVKNDAGENVGRAYLYIMRNIHDKPFGFLEDVFIEENMRGKGVGSSLVRHIIQEARGAGCYKLIANSRHSRPQVHRLYEKIGFKNHGLEFRIEF